MAIIWVVESCICNKNRFVNRAVALAAAWIGPFLDADFRRNVSLVDACHRFLNAHYNDLWVQSAGMKAKGNAMQYLHLRHDLNSKHKDRGAKLRE
eukprot:152906-Amphidinium_carterae.1